VILIFVASLCLNPDTVRTGLFSEVGGLIGKKGADAIQSALNTSNPHAKGLVASAMAIVALIVTATGFFIELQGALNAIWKVEPRPGAGIWGFIKTRLLSFAMLVAIGFLLMVSLVVSTGLAAVATYFNHLMPGLTALGIILNLVFSFIVISVLFAMIFKVLPDVRISWRDCWVGAGCTAFLFTGGKFLLGLYLGKNSTVSAYGAAGSIVLILLWVYYSGQILFFGAEMTKVYANECGTRLVPKRHAQWMTGCDPTVPSTTQKAQPKPDRKAELVNDLRNEVEELRATVQRKKRHA